MNTPILPESSSPEKYSRLGLSASARKGLEADDSKVDFSAIWSTIRRRKWVILITCLLVTAAVTAYTHTLPKVYESTAIVSVEATPAVQSAGAWPGGEGIELSKEIGLLENSGELSRRVVDRLSAIADTTEAEQFTIFDPVDGEEPTRLEVVSRLREQTSFQERNDQSMIQIDATSGSPKEATYIVNAFAEEYRQFSREMARSGVSAKRKFLEEQLQKRREELKNVEDEWEQFAVANDVATDGEGGQRIAKKYVELESRRNELQFQLEQARRAKSTLESQLEEMRPSLRTSVVTEQRIQSLRTQIQTLQEELSQLRMQAGEYYSNNPSLRGNEEQVPELAELKRRIDRHEERKSELTEKLVSLAEEKGLKQTSDGIGSGAIGQVEELRERIQERSREIQQLEQQIQGLDEEISSFEGRLTNIPRQTIRREQIQRRMEQAEQFYQEISTELRETTIAEESELGYVKVVRAGVVPKLPVSPDLRQNILLGILLGLGFGMGMAFVVQSMNSRIDEPKDIQAQGYNLLGVVPAMEEEISSEFNGEATVEVVGKELSTTLLPLLNPWSTVSENYRLMRTNLQYPAGEGGDRESPQFMLITSPEQGDGKTTTAVNLALTFALSGREVLLIDGDLRRPNAHNLIGLDAEPGLSDVLAGERSLEEVKQTFIEGFTFVSAGKTDAPPAELFDSRHMQSVFSEARATADVVIFDSPPVLAASDALILSVKCDATLVVANAGVTDRRALDQVEKTFDGVGVPISAVIVNRFDMGQDYYEYGYGNGEYQEDQNLVVS